jgi:hypothetical protein
VKIIGSFLILMNN